MMKKKLVIFDFDGVIADSEIYWRQCPKLTLKKRGVDIDEDLLNDDKGIRGLVDKFANRFGVNMTYEEIFQEFNEWMYDFYQNDVELENNVVEILSYLKKQGLKIALVTNTRLYLVELILNKYQLNAYFDYQISANDVGLNKAETPIYVKTLKEIGVEAKETIMLDDSLPPLLSGKALGITTVGVFEKSATYRWEKVKNIADYTIKDLNELINIIDF